jgi:hypothetical protein
MTTVCSVLAEHANFLGGSGISNICAEFSALVDGLGLAREFIALDPGDSGE